jgi:SAM-dependent methyltransferase
MSRIPPRPPPGQPRDDGDVTPAADLLSSEGQELLGLLAGQDVNPDTALRLAEELKARHSPGLISAALTQQALRQAGRTKFGLADQMYFTRAGLEQASSDLTAFHSAQRYSGQSLIADLCCGIGGNLAALATAARQVLAVDADLDALRFARYNAAVHDSAAGVTAVCADVQHLVLTGSSVQGIFIDPARRAGERRLRAGNCQPPLGWCLALADQVAAVCIKAAPGLPHDLVPAGWETEFVAVGRELKEALLWSPALATTPRRATILPGGQTLTSAAGPEVPVEAPGEYLLDPSPAVTRAGLVEELARELGAWKIDPMIAFLASGEPVSSPFARTLRVLESMPWHERKVAFRLKQMGIGTADIRRRGLAGDVQQIHRRLGLKGDGSATIILTRIDGKPWTLICSPLPAPGQ